MYTPKALLLLAFFVPCFACEKSPPSTSSFPFAPVPAITSIVPKVADEVSGIADSKLNNGTLWLQEDSGNPTELQLLKYDGTFLKKIFIRNVQNRDWEDLALAPGPVNTINYLYIADIGDNNAQHNNYTIYRFPEPTAAADTVEIADKITFRYPDTAHDAETLFVDPLTRDIYIVTKRDLLSKVYKLAYPQTLLNAIDAKPVATLSFSGAVGGAISGNGNEVIIKTYTGLNYWQRKPNETIEAMLQREPLSLPYKQEPQGEAVCFSSSDAGFFTLSERGFAPSVGIHFYKRL
ncbi:MAG: hypothetical protein WKF70_00030 [Chitinophagaceae bacterium]